MLYSFRRLHGCYHTRADPVRVYGKVRARIPLADANGADIGDRAAVELRTGGFCSYTAEEQEA